MIRILTLWSPRTRQQVLTRISRLAPDASPRWGRMTCAQMVVHITDAFALYSGELPGNGARMPLLRLPLVKHLFIYAAPFPKNAPTAPELLVRVPGPWEEEIARLRLAIEGFALRQGRTEWPPHPLFGSLSERDYGVLAYRHVDHHLRQFGV